MTTETRKRTPEQVHEDDGHTTPVKSCTLCQTEVETDQQAALARAAIAEPSKLAGDGRPKCVVDGCELPEFIENAGLCGGHFATRPDLRKGARRG